MLVLNGSNQCIFLSSLHYEEDEEKRGHVRGSWSWAQFLVHASTGFVAGNSRHVEPRLGIHCGDTAVPLLPPRNAQPPRNAEIRAYAEGNPYSSIRVRLIDFRWRWEFLVSWTMIPFYHVLRSSGPIRSVESFLGNLKSKMEEEKGIDRRLIRSILVIRNFYFFFREPFKFIID